MTDFDRYPATQHPSTNPIALDRETSLSVGDPADVRLWARMFSCCTLIENELRSRLRVEFGSTLPRFDLMTQLVNSPAGLKMSTLSRRMMVTNGNITGITDQLEKERLVQRIKDPKDRRSSLIRLTPRGRRAYQRMQRAHESWLQGLLSGLAPSERTILFDLLGSLKRTTYARLPAG